MGDSKPDVQMLCHQIVAKVSEYSPGGVLGSLDALIEPLEKTCNKQVWRAMPGLRLGEGARCSCSACWASRLVQCLVLVLLFATGGQAAQGENSGCCALVLTQHQQQMREAVLSRTSPA